MVAMACFDLEEKLLFSTDTVINRYEITDIQNKNIPIRYFGSIKEFIFIFFKIKTYKIINAIEKKTIGKLANKNSVASAFEVNNTDAIIMFFILVWVVTNVEISRGENKTNTNIIHNHTFFLKKIAGNKSIVSDKAKSKNQSFEL